MADVRRILIAAPHSGAGKTTVTMALLSAFRARGLRMTAFKCGPDYIDPMFHTEALQIPCRNLDLFLSTEDTVRGLLYAHGTDSDLCALEGVMGYYDGVNNTEEASSYHLAKATKTPTVLVVQAKGAALSLAAQIKGFQTFRTPSGIEGVILNGCHKAQYEKMKPLLEAETGLRLFGYFPPREDCAVKSRHLGLVTADELSDLQERLERLGQQAEESLDLEGLLHLAASAPQMAGALPKCEPVTQHRPRIAVARDAACCFYYADNLALLEQLGAELIFFSPLKDALLPKGTAALYFGGGYPELYAEALSNNTSMRESVRLAVRNGMPTVAECGGYLYLHERLDGHQMAGVIPASAYRTERLQRFGYQVLTAQRDTLLLKKGETLRAHEFHYWESDAMGDACEAQKPDGRTWNCIIGNESLFAGFSHLYFYSNPEIAARFVQQAAAYGETHGF